MTTTKITSKILSISDKAQVLLDIKVLPIDRNEAKKEEVRREFSEKHGIPLSNISVRFVAKEIKNTKQSSEITQNIISNIQNPEFQQKLFKDYMEIREIKNVKFNDILDIDKEVNGYVDFDSYSRYRNYKFKFIKWSNYLSYGPDNYIDFTKLNGLVLVTSDPKNQGGKTTVSTELLRFALFGKSDKSANLDKAFNKYLPEATEVSVELGIEINGEDYVIQRKITRPSLKKRTARSKPKQSVEYYKIVDGNYEDIEDQKGASTKETDNIIKQSVGSIEDFNLIISATSKNLGDLLDLGQTAKAQTFSRWLGLLTLEQKNDIAKDLYKKKIEPSLLTRKGYDKSTMEAEIKDYETCIVEDKKNIESDTKLIKEAEKQIESYNAEKNKAIGSQKEVKEDIANTDVTTVESRMTRDKQSLETNKAILQKREEEYKEVKDASFDQDKYNQYVELADKLKVDNATLKAEIANYRKDNKRIEDLIAKKVCPTCGHPVEVAEQGNFISKNNEEINSRVTKGLKNKERLDKGLALIAKMEENKKKLEEKYKIESAMSVIKSDIKVLEMKIKNNEDLLKEIQSNKENIRINAEIKANIMRIDGCIRTETRTKEDLIRRVEGYKNEIKNFGEEIKNRNTIIKKLDAEEIVVRNWKVYLDMVSKNGIVKIVLKQALPAINQELTRLLDGLCDFSVELSISDNNEVLLEMVRDGIRMDFGTAASGFERTMGALALRAALSNMSTISKPSMLCLDEVLGGVSSDNYDNIHELYRRIMKGYQFILHITHNEMIADWHSQEIKVKKEDNISRIEMVR